MRYTLIGCVTARAAIQKGSPTLYDEVTITRPTLDSAPRFCLRLADGRIIQQKSLTYDGLKHAGFEDVSRQQALYYDDKLGKDLQVSHEIAASGIACLFVDESLVEIRLVSGGTVGVASEAEKQFYTLPLKQEDLEHVFGRPDKISNGVEW
jgi:hypothetical protein